MQTKLKNEPLFLITSLCLFFPIGLIFLIRSEIKRRLKWIFACIGGTIFVGIMLLAFLNQPQPPNPKTFYVTITRETLSPGQSGGLIVTNGKQYYSKFTVTANNDILRINNNVYTAVKPGESTLTIKFGQEERMVNIEVNDHQNTTSIVSASPTGTRYHLINAAHAGKKSVEMTEEDALMSGKTPCKNCFK